MSGVNHQELDEYLATGEMPAEPVSNSSRTRKSGMPGAGLMQRMEELLSQRIAGQRYVIRRVILALFTGVHPLLEGVPGVGKTELAKWLSHTFEGIFHRTQFTPDMLPADVRGTRVWVPNKGEFMVEVGEIVKANIELADEINRAPAKVKAALLDIIGEGIATINGHVFRLPEVFMLIATMNPLEFAGTYPMGEAELDRFAMRIRQPLNTDLETEREIWDINRHGVRVGTVEKTVATPDQVLEVRREIEEVAVTDEVRDYALSLVLATRQHKDVVHGASPRAGIFLLKLAAANSYMEGRPVREDDVRELFPDVINHRLILTADAQMAGKTVDDVIGELLDQV